MLLFMALWVPIFVMLYMRAVPKLWYASLFLRLRRVGFLPPPIEIEIEIEILNLIEIEIEILSQQYRQNGPTVV
jgi:hypothetical protein